MERFLGASSLVLGTLLAVLGVVMVVSTLARGGGPLAFGVILGVLFVLAGAGRLYLAGVRPRRGGSR
ncbi:MAG TPA: hypothetical protein VFY44_06345 [Thermoleophilaceae bacterium]|nr:hypothetical protein [Thermoleophilaceae bacterium]